MNSDQFHALLVEAVDFQVECAQENWEQALGMVDSKPTEIADAKAAKEALDTWRAVAVKLKGLTFLEG